MEEKHTAYLGDQLESPIALYGEKPAGNLDQQLAHILRTHKKDFDELYPSKDATKIEADVSSYKTVCFTTQTNSVGRDQITDFFKEVHPNLHTIVVQNLWTYDLCKPIAETHKLTIVGFNRIIACHVHNGLSQEHPFFLITKETLSNTDNEWIEWKKEE